MVETNTKIDLITLVPFTVASYKHIGKVPEEPMPTARQKMLDWAEGNKLTLSEDQQLLGFNDFMGGGKNGYTFCVPVPTGVEGSGDIVINTFEGGPYATLCPHPTADKIWETFGSLKKYVESLADATKPMVNYSAMDDDEWREVAELVKREEIEKI